MLNQYPHLSLDQPAAYRITMQGRIDTSWSDYMNELTVQYMKDDAGAAITILSGWVADQASLHGLLNHIRDLGLLLLVVEFLRYDR